MATITVTKKSVNYGQPKLHNIVFNLVIKEDEVEVLNKDFSVRFRNGDSVAAKVSSVTKEMQEEINNYKSAKAIFDNSQLDTAVISIQNGLTI